MACAHSVVPFGQISQISGTNVFGQGFVIGGGGGGGGGGWQVVEQSKNLPLHLQLVVHWPSPVPQPDPGVQADPCEQVFMGGTMHVVPHW
jgi:hypothetical protein